MGLPRNAILLAKPFEGWSSTVYICPAGFPTIGYGHRCEADHPPITEEQGLAYLELDMQDALDAALRYCPGLVDNELALGAITDFAFNLGGRRLKTSTLRRRINEMNWPAARKEIRRWVRGGGRVLPGLVLRRDAEAAYLPKV